MYAGLEGFWPFKAMSLWHKSAKIRSVLQLTKLLNETFRNLTSGAAASKPLAVLDLQMPRDRSGRNCKRSSAAAFVAES